MTAGCPYGEDNPLEKIGDGTEVVLVHGRRVGAATVHIRSGGECFHGSFEMGQRLAKQLGLPSGRRYKLDYDEERKTLRIQPSPVSAASAAIRQEAKQNRGSLSIGYGLLSKLGLPDDRPSFVVNVKHGGRSRKLAVRSPSNLFDGGLRLHPDAARELGLAPGKTYRLSYDQLAKVIVFGEVRKRSDERNGGRTVDANRSSGSNMPGEASRPGSANRSSGANRSGGADASNRVDRSNDPSRSGGSRRPIAANRANGSERTDAQASRNPTSAPRRRDGKGEEVPRASSPRNRLAKPAANADGRASRTRTPTSAAKPQVSRIKHSKPAPPVFPVASPAVSRSSAKGSKASVIPPRPYTTKGRAL